MKERCRFLPDTRESVHPDLLYNSYRIRGVMILLMFFLTALISPGYLAFGQTQTITGTVSDQQGQPVIGATVIVKGTTAGTLTDINGQYTLPNVAPDATIAFSFVGFVSQEVAVAGRSKIDITLNEAAIGLEEVVVVGYGTQTRKTLSGAVSNVNEAALQASVAPSVSQRMIGKIAGLSSRITDGRPGSTNALQIRNYGTPLYIIDGIPRTESDFNNLGPNDIESVSILKDASASIYGLLAANGVVLVTTKTGKAAQGKTNITVDGYYGLQEYTRFPHPPNAYEYMLGLAESDQNRGIATTITQETLDRWKQQLYDPANGLDYR